jgi:hypothetical protein
MESHNKSEKRVRLIEDIKITWNKNQEDLDEFSTRGKSQIYRVIKPTNKGSLIFANIHREIVVEEDKTIRSGIAMVIRFFNCCVAKSHRTTKEIMGTTSIPHKPKMATKGALRIG